MKTTLLLASLLLLAACATVTQPKPDNGTVWHGTPGTLTIYDSHATLDTQHSIAFQAFGDTAYSISFAWTHGATTVYTLSRSRDTLSGSVTAQAPNEVFGVAPALFWKTSE